MVRLNCNKGFVSGLLTAWLTLIIFEKIFGDQKQIQVLPA